MDIYFWGVAKPGVAVLNLAPLVRSPGLLIAWGRKGMKEDRRRKEWDRSAGPLIFLLLFCFSLPASKSSPIMDLQRLQNSWRCEAKLCHPRAWLALPWKIPVCFFPDLWLFTSFYNLQQAEAYYKLLDPAAPSGSGAFLAASAGCWCKIGRKRRYFCSPPVGHFAAAEVPIWPAEPGSAAQDIEPERQSRRVSQPLESTGGNTDISISP